jgi:hypothetical protein
LAQEYGVSHLQICGDSFLVIQWLRKEESIKISTLQLYDGVQQHMTTFSHISLSHIYRDKKRVVDGLSKEGLGLQHGTWIASILLDRNTYEFTRATWLYDIYFCFIKSEQILDSAFERCNFLLFKSRNNNIFFMIQFIDMF